MESAMTSRLTSDVRMPAAPIVIPSEMETVLNSIGVPPASLMPCLTQAANWRRWKLHGPISIQVFATPMMGRRKSSSVNPTAFSMARAGARLGPSVIAVLLRFILPTESYLPGSPVERCINWPKKAKSHHLFWMMAASCLVIRLTSSAGPESYKYACNQQYQQELKHRNSLGVVESAL